VKLVLLDLVVRLLQGLGLERGSPDKQDVQDAPDGPDVGLIAVAGLAEDFGGDVVGSATEGLLFFALKVDLRGQAEVADFDLKLKSGESNRQKQANTSSENYFQTGTSH